MSASQTHAYLFADLRGYTAYLERNGATAAAELLARFREVVRHAVATHEGAEIRTEGDSFYIVFPSASRAVACALDIATSAGSHAGGAIRVGLGIHAGEAIETPEGPVGTSVNIAARLCAIAKPGEVIVSETVRSLARSVAAASFVPLGRRRLKGIEEAVTVYRAVPAGSTVTARPRRVAARAAGVAIGGLAVVGAAVLAASTLRITGAAPSVPVTAPVGSTLAASELGTAEPSRATRPPIGHHETRRFAVPFTLTLGPGWQQDNAERPDLLSFVHLQKPVGFFDVLIVEAVLDPPCPDVEPTILTEDVTDWLATRPWLDHEGPRPHNLGPYLGRAVTIEVPSPATWTCPSASSPSGATMFRLGQTNRDAIGGTWTARARTQAVVVAVNTGARTVTLIASSEREDVEQFLSYAVPLMQSIRFRDAGS